jgi:uncharacterized protein
MAIVARPWLVDIFDRPKLRLWSTLFVAICFQALPFLVLGVVVSGLIATFVANDALAKILPTKAIFAVPMAAGAGVFLPGCECSSVPVASRLVERGAAPSSALAFLLASPAINPVVLVATAVAFPNQPRMVFGRFLASFIAATAMGLIWSRRPDLAPVPRHQHRSTGPWYLRMVDTVQHDALHAGGSLVVGAATAATLQTLVARDSLSRPGENMLVAVISMAVLAVVLLVVGAVAVARSARFGDRSVTQPDAADSAHHDHDAHDEHEAHLGTMAAWLLMVPILVLLVVPPGALSASAASRTSSRFADVEFAESLSYAPLVSPDGKPIELAIVDFDLRAISDGGQNMIGVPITLVGFVTTNTQTDDVLIARYSMMCCAADAIISFAALRGPDVVPWPIDTWVRATGYYDPEGAFPTLSVETITVIEPPESPYE